MGGTFKTEGFAASQLSSMFNLDLTQSSKPLLEHLLLPPFYKILSFLRLWPVT